MGTANNSGSLRLGSTAAAAAAMPLVAMAISGSELRPPRAPRRRTPPSTPLGLETSALAEATERTKPGKAARG